MQQKQVEALTQWAFDTSKVEKIKAETLKDSIASMRVLEKLGMKKVNQTETMVYWESWNEVRTNDKQVWG